MSCLSLELRFWELKQLNIFTLSYVQIYGCTYVGIMTFFLFFALYFEKGKISKT